MTIADDRLRPPPSTREAGQAVLLDPDVPHDVEAIIERDMLLSVHLSESR